MAEPRVGPNAILQTMEALTELGGMDLTRRVFSAAGLLPLLEAPPSEMVPEVWASDLHRTITTELPAVEAARVAADGGHRTGFYILENRIPAVARTLLQLLPGSVAGSILLRAIERHAWTFAGSAEVAIEIGTPMYFFIYDNPWPSPAVLGIARFSKPCSAGWSARIRAWRIRVVARTVRMRACLK